MVCLDVEVQCLPVDLVGGSSHQQVCIVWMVRQVATKLGDAGPVVGAELGMEGQGAVGAQEHHLRVVLRKHLGLVASGRNIGASCS